MKTRHYIIIGIVPLAIVISVFAYFELDWTFEQSPEMIVVLEDQEYKTRRGAYGANPCFSNGGFIVDVYSAPVPSIRAVRNSNIEFKILDYLTPTEIDIFVYENKKDDLFIAEQNIHGLDVYTHNFDYPPGEYRVATHAKWFKDNCSADAWYESIIVII